MVGPHLSGLEFLGHKVTVGKVNSSIGYVMVSSTVIVGLSYHTINLTKKRINIQGNEPRTLKNR